MGAGLSDVILAVFGFAALLGLVSVLVPIAKRLGLPYTVLIAVLGAGLGYVSWAGTTTGGALDTLVMSLKELDVSSDAFFYIFLPPLLFAGGLTVDVRRMMDDVAPVMVLAVIAVVMCMAMVGLSLYVVTGAALVTCLLLGTIVATTDTAAVLGIFRDIGAPGRLTTIVEGESLFNDAAAIAIFLVLLGVVVSQQEIDIFRSVYEFFYGLLGGMVWGYLLALAFTWAIGQFRGAEVTEITLSLSLAYLTFVTAQAVLQVSGIIAVVVAAMTFASEGRTKLSPGTWGTLLITWRQLEFWATSMIFVLAAMLTPKMVQGLEWVHLIGVATIFVAALVARAGVLWGILPLLSLAGWSQPVSNTYKLVLCWGSLRGAVTAALALSVFENDAVAEETRTFVFVLAMGYVLVTLFLSAPTLRPLMRMLRLDKLTPQERLVRDRVMALSRVRVREGLASVGAVLGLKHSVADEGHERNALETAKQELSKDDLVRAGLLISCNREAEMSLEYLQRGVVGRRIAERLRSDTAKKTEGVRQSGAAGYTSAAVKAQEFPWSFRLASWLQRHLGWTGPLANEIADRFELLIVKQLMQREILEFTENRIVGLIGQHAAMTVKEVTENRIELIQSAISALDLQYSEFTQAMRRQFLERLSIGLEEAEYRSQLEQSLISEEVFEDLEEDRTRRRLAAEHRPPLNLGLELVELFERHDMFKGMNKSELARLGALFRPQLAVPGEAIMKAGEMGDKMYFIASGAVEVRLPNGGVFKLERGNIIGEMALLTRQPRSADVVSSAYTSLLVLRDKDLDVFKRQYPHIRQKIDDVAQRRIAENMRAATH